MKRLLKIKENQICLGIFIITMFVAISPLISRYCINGHDLEYHLLRIESLKEGIAIGRPFMKVNTLFFGGAGYASSMFYSDFLMYIPAVLRALGMSIKGSYHIFVALIFVLGYISAYYCVWKMTDSKYAGTIGAVLFTLCPYHMDDMLVRGACGEYMAFIFVPLVIYALYNMIYEDMSHPTMFVLGYGGLLLSHPATFVFCVIFGVIVILVNAKTIFGNRKLLVTTLVAVSVTMLLTAFQWVPMLEQLFSAGFYVSSDSIDMLDAAVSFNTVFSQGFPAVGVLLLAGVIPRVFLDKKIYPVLSFVDMMIVIAMAFAIGATDVMPWHFLERFLRFVQFPWRMFIMTSTLLAVSDAIIITLYFKEMFREKISIAVITVLAIASGLAITHMNANNPGYYDYSDDYYSYKPYTANVIGGEWLPDTVTDREMLVGLSEHMITSSGNEIDFDRVRGVVTATVSEAYDFIDVPFIYYKGYEATLTDTNAGKQKLVVSGEGIDGMCRVYTNGATGVLSVDYKGTSAIAISAVISAVTLLVLFGLYVRKSGKGKKMVNNEGKASAKLVLALAALFLGLVSLTACQASDVQKAADQIEELNKLMNESKETNFSDPDKVVGYLKEKDSVPEEADFEEEVEETSYISINLSEYGYDENGTSFAVKTTVDGDNKSYELMELHEALAEGATTKIDKNLYDTIEKRLESELTSFYEGRDITTGNTLLNEKELKEAIITEAQLLMFIECYSESSRVGDVTDIADKLAYLIYESTDFEKDDLVLKYNCSAILAKAAYVIEDLSFKEDAKKQAEKLWDEAEVDNEESTVAEINRAWAASELYRLGRAKTYRTVFEAVSSDINLTGVSYDEPGCLAVFAYLNSTDSTNYEISNALMSGFLSKVNHDVKSDRQELLQRAVDAIETEGDSENLSDDFVNEIAEEATMAMMANYISMSVEYTRYAQDRILMLAGANPVATNYITENQDAGMGNLVYSLLTLSKK